MRFVWPRFRGILHASRRLVTALAALLVMLAAVAGIGSFLFAIGAWPFTSPTASPRGEELVSMPPVYARPLDEALAVGSDAGFTTQPRIERVCSDRLAGVEGVVREVLIDVEAPDGEPSDVANRIVGAPGEQVRSVLHLPPETRLHFKVTTGDACN